MEHARIQNVVVGSWGTGTIFSYDREPTHTRLNTFSKTNIIKTSDMSNHVIVPRNDKRKSYPSLSSITEKTEESKQPFTQQDGLTYFMSSLISTSLEDTLIQLRCLDKCNNELKIIKTLADINHLKILKFGVKPFAVLDNILDISKEEVNSTIKKVAKLEADRGYVNNILQKTYLELALTQTFNTLKESNKEIISREDYQNDLEIEEARNRVTRREISKQVRQQRNHIKSVLYDTNGNIEQLKSRAEDSVLLTETCCRYVDNWQVARTEQNAMTIANKEVNPITTINYYKQRSEHEHRVHSEVELLVNIVINETLTKVEKWMDKYDRDMENIDLKIQLKKNEYQDMRDTRISMEQKLEKHDQMMKDWIHFKEEREKARLYQEKMTNAATVVQAWWRGLIVRLKLGPYKEKKNKGKKKK